MTLYNLEPTIHLAHQLKKTGIKNKKIAIAFCRIGNSKVELIEGKDYIEETGFFLLDGAIPESTGYGSGHGNNKDTW